MWTTLAPHFAGRPLRPNSRLGTFSCRTPVPAAGTGSPLSLSGRARIVPDRSWPVEKNPDPMGNWPSLFALQYVGASVALGPMVGWSNHRSVAGLPSWGEQGQIGSAQACDVARGRP